MRSHRVQIWVLSLLKSVRRMHDSIVEMPEMLQAKGDKTQTVSVKSDTAHLLFITTIYILDEYLEILA